jgi:hypothetical protein
MSRSKRKGTAAETSVVRYLNENHFRGAERRALAGANDKGDVTGIDDVVIEVKAGVRLQIPEWLKETEQERKNAKADIGVLVIKPKGKGDATVHQWWAVMTLQQACFLMRRAGYGEKP